MWHNHGHVVGIFPNFSEKSTKQCQTVNKKSIIMDVQKFIFLRNFCVKLNAMWTPSERHLNAFRTGTVFYVDERVRLFTWIGWLFMWIYGFLRGWTVCFFSFFPSPKFEQKMPKNVSKSLLAAIRHSNFSSHALRLQHSDGFKQPWATLPSTRVKGRGA